MNNIIWEDHAKEEYWQNVAYLIEKWTTAEAENFINTVDEYLELIKQNPRTFQRSTHKNIHQVVIVKQITLFYSVDGKNIYLLRFWNNAKDPDTRLL